jgi:hypothetical protein
MAEFGSWVITNKWKNKDPSVLSPAILAVDLPSPQAIAERMVWACDRYQNGRSSVSANLPHVFRSEGEEFPFLSSLLGLWRIQLRTPSVCTQIGC